ncbi:MAG: GtrA family protein [Alphaproteobacteria bacterium]|nr:GtrA family protein [Alphaproteobacteria bacterium]
MNVPQLIFRYVAFAALATLANLAMQRLVLEIVHGAQGFALAVVSGTAVGLLLKYVLDKKWIFFDTSAGILVQSRKFSLYTVMGVITTLIFWSTESAFYFFWQTDLMREIGAVLGLAIGYVIKFRLDRRFVFRQLTENSD